jgi:hypothetical protein
MPFALSRHLHGISLNPKEYIIGDDGKIKTFNTKEEARHFAIFHGFTKEEFEEGAIMVDEISIPN